MEKNAIMNLNNIIYRIYDAEDISVLKSNILHDVRMLVPCSYASILVSSQDQSWPILADPCCVPEEFCAAEEKYVELEDRDHLLWTIHSGQPIVIRESQVMSDEKRLESPIYQRCYRKYNVFDTLQLSLVHEKVFMGVLTLFRTVSEGAFSDEDAFYLEMLGSHLSKCFYENSYADREAKDHAREMEKLKEQFSLTKREAEILSMIFENIPDDQISEQLHISPNTLKKHMQNIYHKLDISARWELIRYKP